jgi:hypothetical protein
VREKGLCWLEFHGNNIVPDRHDVKDADYFAPDGSKIAEVRGGSGVQKICYPNGIVSWELLLKDGKRVKETQRFLNGSLAWEATFPYGNNYKQFKRFRDDGTIIEIGESCQGNKYGKWVKYDRDGNVLSEEQYLDYPRD